MTIIHKPAQLHKHLQQYPQKQSSIGFVPTMGALHSGHLTLVERSAAQCDVTVCSIFVNPAQFNDPNDYARYPNRLGNDIKMLEAANATVLFLPSAEDIYPDGTAGLETYDLGYLGTILEGKFRPGHFQGVCQVMKRLLDAVQPHQLFMGQKDYQQCMVVEKLLADAKFDDVRLDKCPTLRERNGLAMSSRNLRLTPEERDKAGLIYATLVHVKNSIRPGDLRDLKNDAASRLEKEGFRVDYFEIADAVTLKLADEWNGTVRLVALAAAFAGEVRLIDNMLLDG